MEDLGFETPLYSNFPNATLEINCLLGSGISPSVSLNLPVIRPAISCTTWHLGVPIFPMTQEGFTIVLDGEEICFSGMTHLGMVRVKPIGLFVREATKFQTGQQDFWKLSHQVSSERGKGKSR